MTPVEVRRVARESAQDGVRTQKEEFAEFAIMGDWKNAYHTFGMSYPSESFVVQTKHGLTRHIDHDYEIRQLRVFRDMVARGL
jgi:isoleucyl-tRNA synthetase